MDGFAIFLFITTLIVFIITVILILTNPPDMGPSSSPDETSSGIPLPDSTMIGAQCPVGCTCFPNAGATTPKDKPTQMCAVLNNDVMFACPARCCQPTCINQDVQEIEPRVGN